MIYADLLSLLLIVVARALIAFGRLMQRWSIWLHGDSCRSVQGCSICDRVAGRKTRTEIWWPGLAVPLAVAALLAVAAFDLFLLVRVLMRAVGGGR